MKILIYIGHPGHVLHFRYFIKIMQKRGHKIKVISKDKDVSIILLKRLHITYTLLGKTKIGLINKIFWFFYSGLKLLFISLKFKPDLMMGRASPELALSSFILRKPYLCFSDTEHAKVNRILAHPSAYKIVTPSFFKLNLGKNQVRVNTFFEMAYLHPTYFKPNAKVLNKLHMNKSDKFFILRFVSWDASHDLGQKGLSLEDKEKLIKYLSKYGKVFISSESKLPDKFEKYRCSIPPEQIHDLLYYSTAYIGEGGTMAAESALLGTPSIFISSLTGTMGNFIELEKNLLMYSFNDYASAIVTIKKLINTNNLKKIWQLRRKSIIKSNIDLTKWMVDFVEKEFK